MPVVRARWLSGGSSPAASRQGSLSTNRSNQNVYSWGALLLRCSFLCRPALFQGRNDVGPSFCAQLALGLFRGFGSFAVLRGPTLALCLRNSPAASGAHLS